MGEYQHYLRISDGIVVHGFSSAFEQPDVDDICIDDDAPRHFSLPLRKDNGQYAYRMVEGSLTERPASELEQELSNLPPTPPTPEQRVEQLEQEKAQLEQRVLAAESAILFLMDLS